MVSTLCSSSKRVAVLVDYLYDYQVQVQRGVHIGLDQHHHSSVTFVGRHLNPHDPVSSQANKLYSLIRAEDYAGMILSAATFGQAIGNDAVSDFLKRYQLPQVTITHVYPGIPAVTIDHTQGLTDLMNYLITQRKFTKFVYMGGKADNPETIVRENVVRSVLHSYGLDLPQERLLTGDFHGPAAEAAMLTLLEHDRDFEVVVCANDEMAFGVMQALEHQGLHLPMDVAVTGFDDVAEARHATPALTTVKQPLFESGQIAVDLLFKKILEPDLSEELTLAASVMKRKSCGALPDWVTAPPTHLIDAALLKAFQISLLDPASVNIFLEQWRRTVSRLDHDYAALTAAILGMRAGAECLINSPQTQERATSMLLMALSMIDTHDPGHLSAQRSLALNNQVSTHRELTLTSQENITSFALAAQEYLNSLGVKTHALILYTEFTTQPGPEARVVLSSFTAPGATFPTAQLLPEACQSELDHGHWLIMPLYSGEVHFGLILLQLPGQDDFSCEQLRNSLSTGLQALHASEQRLTYTQQLEAQVLERTQELKAEIAVRINAEEALKAMNQELSVSANTDALTGIFNRAAFNAYYQREWSNHLLARRPLSVLLCDIDQFKQYNDTYGHLQGDVCLQRVAQVLSSSGRNRSDFTARYGGEEFVLILPGTDQAGAALVAQRLLNNVRAEVLPHEASSVADRVTISVGVATVIPNLSWKSDELLDWADQALYHAKQHGRNQAFSWVPERTTGEALKLTSGHMND